MLEAFRIVCRRNENMRLILVGGSLEIHITLASDYFQMVQRLPENLGIADKVTWTGHFNWDSDEGSRYLYGGDLCVLPFDYGVTLNNSSLAAASTHGVPVIGTELPVGRDEALEHGENIYLCRPRDPKMLAEAIQLMSENTGLRESLRLGILDLARDWHRWETTTERLVRSIGIGGVSGKVPAPPVSPACAASKQAELNKEELAFEMHPHNRNGDLSGVPHHDSHLVSTVSLQETV